MRVLVMAGVMTLLVSDSARTWAERTWAERVQIEQKQESPADAQEAPPARHVPDAAAGPPLTLDGALDEALSRNPELIALRKQLDAARHRPEQELWLGAPTLEAQIWQWPLRSANPADTHMYMFTVRQELPGAGKRRLRAAVAEREVDMADAGIAVRAREIIGDVKRAYAALFLARKTIDLHVLGVDLLRQFADVSSAKYATGAAPQQDVLKAIVEISRLHEDLLMLDEQASIAGARLNALLDRAPDAPIGPLAEPGEQPLQTTVAELQQLAIDRQPELRAATLEVTRAQAAQAVAARELKPDLSIAGGYMLMPRGGDAWTGSIGVTWPSAPWSRGKVDAQRAEASAQIEAARARERAAVARIRLAVQEAYVRVKAAERRAELLRTSLLPQTLLALDASRIAYQTDRVDMLTIIDNQRQRLDAQVRYYGALNDLSQARADLERAVGIDLAPAMLGPVVDRAEVSR